MPLFYHVLYVFSIVASYVMTFIVLRNKYKTKAIWQFFGFLFHFSGWIFTLYLFYTLQHETAVYLIGKANFAFVAMMLFHLLLFIYEYPSRSIKLPKVLVGGLLVESVALTLAALFTKWITVAEIINGPSRETVFGPLYPWFIVHFLVFMIAIMAVLAIKYRKSSGLEKLQLTYILLGIAIAFGFGSTTNLFIPYFFQYYDAQNLGSVAALILNFSLFYTVMKHRLFDIKLFIKRAFVKILAVAFVTVLFVPVYFVFKIINEVSFVQMLILIMLAFLSYSPIERMLVRWLDQQNILQLYSTSQALRDVLAKLPTFIDFDDILTFIYQIVNNKMGVTSIRIVTRLKDEGDLLVSNKLLGRERGSVDKHVDALMAFLKRNEYVILYEELLYYKKSGYYPGAFSKTSVSRLLKVFEEAGISALIPLASKGRVIGFLDFGSKLRQDAYTEQDSVFLDTLGRQASISIENAILYSRMKDFNRVLQERVDQATKKLRKANDQLKELDRQKTEFVSIVSHQLRAPLTATNGYISMLLEGDMGKLPTKVNASLEKLSIIANSSKSLIEDLLNMSRIESGKIQYEMQEHSFSGLAQSIYDELKFVAFEKKLDFTLTKPKKDIKVIADINKLRQVIVNITDNAIKYTPEGSVTMSLALENGGKNLVFTVKDSGLGITAQELDYVFKKFSRSGTTRHIKGNGLGLYIAKQFIEAHDGGEIWVASEGEGKGALFGIRMNVVK